MSASSSIGAVEQRIPCFRTADAVCVETVGILKFFKRLFGGIAKIAVVGAGEIAHFAELFLHEHDVVQVFALVKGLRHSFSVTIL